MSATVRADAPLRISFAGGGTDFPHYFEHHTGAVLSATIDRCARVAVARRPDRTVTIGSTALDHRIEYELDRGPRFDGLMDLAKAAIERFGADLAVDLDVATDAAPGSGLGGSSALVTACVAALAALEGRSMSALEVARLSYAIEREDVGIAGGWQDQFAAAFGGFNLLEFSARGVTVTPLALEEDAIEELRAHLLLCDTGHVRTDLGLIDEQIRLYAAGREETIIGMKQLHEIAYEMRDALEAGAFAVLGALLREAYESKKRMNPRVTDGTPIERLLDAALAAGAVGGKICGAGGGGHVLVACEPARRESVTSALEAYGGRVAEFSFRADGVRARTDAGTWRPM